MALPPDLLLLADLVEPHWKPVGKGEIQIEAKEEVKKRLAGRPIVPTRSSCPGLRVSA